MQIQCPGCGGSYRINTERSGRSSGRVRCPKCSRIFEVQLDGAVPKPVTEPPPAAAPATAAPVAGNGKGAGATILVVDDARFFREMILDLLAPLGARVLTAADGEAALELVRREQPQLVILDLNLPKMSGYDLVRGIRAECGQGIKLLAMSGVFRKDEDISGIERAGADDFTSKSFKPETFLARVRKLLGS
ncbi:hypothetical protein JCM30471_04640 [Desulfuromonas carbonis]|uniref:response regulator n=1 Tax=Desulfuromonas sp. DDH964 TaxID=1823759 RepID=UPI00078D38EE|nr:response regulator [Desulfuromonas sp. DDH964]AMV71966.1 response regulator, PilZ domain-containing [Desulfuromonas sp. DDH964]